MLFHGFFSFQNESFMYFKGNAFLHFSLNANNYMPILTFVSSFSSNAIHAKLNMQLDSVYACRSVEFVEI